MSLRPRELSEIAAELNASLSGAFVQKAHAPLPRLCFLELRLPGRSVRVCLSAEAGFSRVSVADARFPSPESPPAFQKWLRQELIGAKLAHVSQPDPYVAKLEFERKDGRRVLWASLRGTGANLVLTEGDTRILAASVQEGERTRPGATFEIDGTPDDDPSVELPSRLGEADAAQPFARAEQAEALFGAKERARRAQEIRKRLEGPLRAKLKRIDSTLEKVRAEAARTDDAEEHRAIGELLAQNLHRIQRGQTQVALTRWTERGAEEVTVPLSPARTPKEEVDWRFHQYKRLLRGVEHAQRRLTELEEERAQLQREVDGLRARDDDDLLEHVSLLSQPAKKGPERGKSYKEFVAQTGARILVGRSNQDNDELTFRVARPYDLWLHARGVPGSHVILECQKNEEVPQEALLDAATLAHHHSQRKAEPRGEVAYTQVKFVKKQKGGAPGQVTYTRDRSLVVRVEPDRLQRLLNSPAYKGREQARDSR